MKLFSKVYTHARFMIVGLMCLPVLLHASVWTDYWTEYPNDPIYNPIVTQIAEDYFPCVLYDADSFSGHGGAYPYKMWHQGQNLPSGDGALAYSYSNDGIAWTLGSQLLVGGDPFLGYHPCVIYDKDGFGGSGYYYKMWYWNGVATTNTVSCILFTQSTDGVNWEPPVSITQNVAAPLAVGIGGQWFYHLYGPGIVVYNAAATNQPGSPYTYRYVMFFHTATEGEGPGTSVQQVGLAYSSDGLDWSRYGTDPVIIPSGNATDWDGSHAFNGTFFRSFDGLYHLLYSGSNDLIDPATTVQYAYGIGIAHSADGLTWMRDIDNPIFIYSDGVTWRDSRTYTPTAVYNAFCGASSTDCTMKLWFTGGQGIIAGADQGIGYATAPCPVMPPTSFTGTVFENQFLNRTVCQLTATWTRSASCSTVAYRIFKNGITVADVPADQQSSFTTRMDCVSMPAYEIAAVDGNGNVSVHIPLVVVS